MLLRHEPNRRSYRKRSQNKQGQCSRRRPLGLLVAVLARLALIHVDPLPNWQRQELLILACHYAFDWLNVSACYRSFGSCTNMYLLPGCEAVQAAISMPATPRPTPTSSSRFGRHRCGTTGSEFLSLSISSGCSHARFHPRPVPLMQPPVHCLPRRLWKVDALFLPLLSRAEGEQDGDQQAPR